MLANTPSGANWEYTALRAEAKIYYTIETEQYIYMHI